MFPQSARQRVRGGIYYRHHEIACPLDPARIERCSGPFNRPPALQAGSAKSLCAHPDNSLSALPIGSMPRCLGSGGRVWDVCGRRLLPVEQERPLTLFRGRHCGLLRRALGLPALLSAQRRPAPVDVDNFARRICTLFRAGTFARYRWPGAMGGIAVVFADLVYRSGGGGGTEAVLPGQSVLRGWHRASGFLGYRHLVRRVSPLPRAQSLDFADLLSFPNCGHVLNPA